jgi:hypothetical protein
MNQTRVYLSSYNMERQDYSDIGERYQSGATLRQIAADFGVAHTTIEDVLHAENIELRTPGRKPERAPQIFAYLYTVTDVPLLDLADFFQKDQRTLERWRAKEDLSKRSKQRQQYRSQSIEIPHQTPIWISQGKFDRPLHPQSPYSSKQQRKAA